MLDQSMHRITHNYVQFTTINKLSYYTESFFLHILFSRGLPFTIIGVAIIILIVMVIYTRQIHNNHADGKRET